MNKILPSADRNAAVAACRDALMTPGAVVLVPTETVYGLICRWDDQAAIDRIYELKDRDRSKLLAMFARDYRMAQQYGLLPNPRLERLVRHFCPGPLTVIGRTAAGGTLGLRFPDHPLILALLREIDFPLASTSANRSGRPNALTVEQALEELTGDVTLAVDGGPIAADALASTVVSLVDGCKILRPGPIAEAELAKVLAEASAGSIER